jgi:hypothetical protein
MPLEHVSSSTPSNINDVRTVRINDYQSNIKVVEANPLNEHFMVMKNNRPMRTQLNTTCRPEVTVVSHSSTLLDRAVRQAVELTTDDSRTQDSDRYENDEMKSFMMIDDEKLNRELLQMPVNMDGSGDST